MYSFLPWIHPGQLHMLALRPLTAPPFFDVQAWLRSVPVENVRCLPETRNNLFD